MKLVTIFLTLIAIALKVANLKKRMRRNNEEEFKKVEVQQLGGQNTCLPPMPDEEWKGQQGGSCPAKCPYSRCEQRAKSCCLYNNKQTARRQNRRG